ncbi:MAG: GAF domain-containing protein, partial [Pseudomonadota bacterium]|nr:GAF domain-containing protein [Pseudomonadota bacterium]
AAELEQELRLDAPPVEAQKTIIHSTFVDITRGLVEAWSLGPFIKDVVAPGKANSKAASLVRHSVEMAKLSEAGWRGSKMEAVLEQIADDIGEPPATVRDRVKVNAGEAARVAVSLGIPQVTALMPGSNPDQQATATQAPEVDPSLQLQILRDLTHSLAEKPDINEVCQLVIEGIHRAIGMQRVALLMTDKSGHTLVPRKLGGKGTEAWKDGFSISKDGTGQLGALLPHASCYTYLPQDEGPRVDYDNWLGQVPALIGPLNAKGRLVGLFYADNAAADYVPSDEQLAAFAHFVQNAQLCLTMLSSQ